MEVIGIWKSYGKKKVLNDISFQIEKGTCTGFIGANGCGKSTLFRILAGVEKADAGKVLVNGKVGYVSQENALLEELSVKDNIKLFASLAGKKAKDEWICRLCEQFSVVEFEREKVSRLSGGMKKRVSIVCALVNQPEILIMDEPSAALDLLFKEELKQCIRSFTKAGGSVLISSHDQGEIANCDKLYAMKNGRISVVDSSLGIEEIIEQYIR